jgi:hypothetical protein
MCIDQQLWGYNLTKYYLVWEVGTVGPVHYKTPHTAGGYIHFAGGGGETRWSPPLADVLLVVPGFKYQFARRI